MHLCVNQNNIFFKSVTCARYNETSVGCPKRPGRPEGRYFEGPKGPGGPGGPGGKEVQEVQKVLEVQKGGPKGRTRFVNCEANRVPYLLI